VSRSHAQAQLDDSGVDGVLRVLGGCAQAHSPDVSPELVSELETCSRAFTCDCSHCSLGMLRRGSRGRRGKCGRGHLGRRDRSIMTARRCCRSVFCGDRGIARVGSCFTGARARVWAKVPLTRGGASKARGRMCPFKPVRRARIPNYASHYLLPLALASRSPFSLASAAPPLLALPARPRLRRRDVELDAL
jgi:hypothetical protein